MTHIKLPTIKLPEFNGAYDEWMHFYDMFNSLIHLNNALTPVQKFHYLSSSVKGDAAQIMSSLDISADNYEIAWNLLRERFENHRLIVNNHVKALFNLPTIAKDSFTDLRHVLDATVKHLRALKSLNQPTEHWDTLVVHLITAKLDYNSKRDWENSIEEEEIPTWEQLNKFLLKRAQTLENMHTIQTSVKQLNFKGFNKQSTYKGAEQARSYVSTNTLKCYYCKDEHAIYQCKEFLKMPIQQRITEVKKLQLCLNCLRSGHRFPDCNSSNCRVCNKSHNTLLHIEERSHQSNPNKNVTVNTHCAQQENQVLLSTALVLLLDHKGKAHECRILLDSGSQSNFISQDMCKRLKLSCKGVDLPVVGINQVKTNIVSRTIVKLKSKFNSYVEEITCLVLPVITGDLPNNYFNVSQIGPIPSNITLADPNFNVPGKIDLLIGASVFWDLLCVGQIKLAKNQPTLQKTKLGWIISGPVPVKDHAVKLQTTFCHFSLEQQLEKFWMIENVNNEAKPSAEDLKCEQHFIDTTTHAEDGRFMVSLPMRDEIHKLGDSKPEAIKRLYAMEKKFERNPELRKEYCKFMTEYEDLGHMEQVSEDDSTTQHYHMPHHAVLKQSSETTKLRVVFDASAKTSTGVSLNEMMRSGPTIQEELFNIILRFRIHRYVITSDIAKMYRQIYIHESQRDLQRIVWRNDTNEPIKQYKLKTVTYGTAAAPFLAIRSLQETAKEVEKEFPEISSIIHKDFYVDDLLTGTDSVEDTICLVKQLNKILKVRGSEFRKWSSNHIPILRGILQNDITKLHMLSLDNTERGILGLLWNPEKDTLQYQIRSITTGSKITKRSILSVISQIYDPLGLIGAVTITGKIIMQELWTLKLGWDEAVPIKLHTAWAQFTLQLPKLKELAIS